MRTNQITGNIIVSTCCLGDQFDFKCREMYKFACSECTVHVQDDYLSIQIAAAGFLDLVSLSEEVCK